MKVLKYAINKALSDGDLVIYKQPIVRLSPKDTEPLVRHYEVLTLVKGELSTTYELDNIEVLVEELEAFGATRYLDIAVTKQVLRWLALCNERISELTQNEDSRSLERAMEEIGEERLFHINIHPDSINYDSDMLLEKINRALSSGNIKHENLCFEITENTLLKNPEAVGKMLEQLRLSGCKIALDDFGKKMLNLTTLRILRPDFVKIDGDYVKRSLTSEFDRVVIKSLVELSKLVGAETIAEKVETVDIYYLMRALGVDYGQGWYFSKGYLLEDAVASDIFRADSRIVKEVE
jgi:EAL domain-containing protein (putative c-di-GMP-specific phosphodiesterase class I)